MGDNVSGLGFFDAEHGPKVESKETVGPKQMALINQLTDILSGQVGEGVEAYAGPRVAGLGDLESQLLGGAGGQLDKVLQTATGEFDRGQAEDYWRKTFVDPAMQKWEDVTAPAIMEKFAGLDALDSGASRRALTKGASDLETGLYGKLGEIIYQGEEAQKNRQLQAPQVLQQGLDIGALPRGIEQKQLEAEGAKWTEEQAYNNPWLKLLGTATQQTRGIATTPPWEEEGIWSQLWGK
jgi:hypothetical protein